MAHIVLDTDGVSLYRAGRLPTGLARQVATNDISISFADRRRAVEVVAHQTMGRRPPRRAGLWLDGTAILPAGLQVAKVWGEITTRAQRRGRRRPLNDAWIAACCVKGGLPRLQPRHRPELCVGEGRVGRIRRWASGGAGSRWRTVFGWP